MKTGQTLGHYRILRQLGKGGMGEVYLAEDTRLQRQVALKVLPESLRQNPERLARFRREALAAAKLKHPNIAVIHALEEAVPGDATDDGDVSVRARHASPQRERPDDRASIPFIVMEYVEGDTLSAHIPSDGMDLDAFFATFIPLADALAHAHSHGRIHRDLKPGNIMIASDGTPKILDFGLARIIEPDPVQGTYEETETTPAFDPDAPTVTMKPEDHQVVENVPQGLPSLTRGGQLMGTPQYMSPEQAEREETDHRTDIFSFGVVMYEALTGQKPFEGKTLESIIGRILTEEPKPVSQLKPITPHTLWWTVRMCLQKDRDRRMQTALELHEELCGVWQEVNAGTVLVDASTISLSKPVPFWRQPKTIGIMVLLVVLTGLTAWFLKPLSEIPEPPLRTFHLALGEDVRWQTISPDGSMIAFIRENRLWIYDLKQGTTRELLTEAEDVSPPLFWSPHSDVLGYIADRGLWTVDTREGHRTRLCPLPHGAVYATWGPVDTIALNVRMPGIRLALYTVPAQGGRVEPFLLPDSTRGEFRFETPRYLPDGTLMFTASYTGDSTAVESLAGRYPNRAAAYRTWRTASYSIELQSPKAGRRTLSLPQDIAFPVGYVPTGVLLYSTPTPESGFAVAEFSGTYDLWAVPFSLASLEVTGDPVLLAQSIRVDISVLANDGTLVYRAFSSNLEQQLVWADRSGKTLGRIGQPQELIQNPDLSPDGKWVAVAGREQIGQRIWIHEVDREIKTFLTLEAGGSEPTWSPNGDRIVWTKGGDGLWITTIDGTDESRRLVDNGSNATWSQDGRYLVYQGWSEGTGRDVWYLEMTKDSTPRPVVTTPYQDAVPVLSPDSRYLAYVSDRSGRYEVYVTRFPDGKGRWPVSNNGGVYPRWNGRGGELFYVEPETNRLMVVKVETGDFFRVVEIQSLFTGEDATVTLDAGAYFFPSYDVTSDGQRFVVVRNVNQDVETTPTITVVENWVKEFEGRE